MVLMNACRSEEDALNLFDIQDRITRQRNDPSGYLSEEKATEVLFKYFLQIAKERKIEIRFDNIDEDDTDVETDDDEDDYHDYGVTKELAGGDQPDEGL